MTHVPDRLVTALADRYRLDRELGAGDGLLYLLLAANEVGRAEVECSSHRVFPRSLKTVASSSAIICNMRHHISNEQQIQSVTNAR